MKPFASLNPGTSKLTRAGLIAALYAALCLVLQPISYGPLQFRAAEALTVLPIFFPEAVPGLFVGCLIANIMSPVGLVDVIGGSLVTLAAAYLTRVLRRSFLAYLSPIVLNGFLVSLYLHMFFKLPYWITVLYIGASEAAVVLLLGVPLAAYLNRHQDLFL